MKILLTGASGYIGARLLIRLIQEGHFVYVLMRNPLRFNPPPNSEGQIEVIKGDILDTITLNKIPKDIEASYYLIHSMNKDAEIIGHATVWSLAALAIIFLGGYGLVIGPATIYGWIRIS